MKQCYREKIYNFQIPKYDPNLLLAKTISRLENIEHKTIDIYSLEENELNHLLLNFIRHVVIKDYNNHCHSPSFVKDPKEYFYWFKKLNLEIGKVYPFLNKVIHQQINAKRIQAFAQRPKDEGTNS
jgi:hypothetical protein